MTIVVRTIGIHGYGVLIFMATLSSFFYPLLSLGLPSAMVRYFQTIRNTLTQYLLFWRILRIIFAINISFSFIIYWLTPRFFQGQIGTQGHESLVMSIICFAVILTSLENSLLEFQRAVYLLRSYLIIQVFQASALFVVAIFQPLLKFSLSQFLISYVATRSILFVIFLVRMILIPTNKLIDDSRTLNSKNGKNFDSDLGLRKLISFGLPMSIAGLGNWLLSVSDRLVISRDLSLSQLGIYGVVNNFALIFPAITSGFFLLAYPRIIRASQDSLRYMAQIIKSFHIAISFALTPVLILMLTFGPQFLELFLGVGEPDTSIVMVLCLIASMIHQWNGLTSYLIITLEETRLVRNVWLAGGLLNLALNLLFVPKYHLIGAAVINLLTYFFIDGIFFIIAARRFGSFSFYSWKENARILLYSLLSVGTSKLFGLGISDTNMRLIFEVFLFLVLYLFVVFLRHRKELATMFNFISISHEEI